MLGVAVFRISNVPVLAIFDIPEFHYWEDKENCAGRPGQWKVGQGVQKVSHKGTNKFEQGVQQVPMECQNSVSMYALC